MRSNRTAILFFLVVALGLGGALVVVSMRARRELALATAATAAARSDRERAEAAEWEARRRLYAGDLALAFTAHGAGDATRVREILDRQVPGAGKRDPRGWEWRFLDAQVRTDLLRSLGRTAGDGQRLLVSPDGARVVASDNMGEVVEWSLGEVREVRRARLRGVGMTGMAWARDGGWLALNDRIAGASNTVVHFVEARSWVTNRSWAVPGLVGVRAVASDGETVWLTGRDLWVALSVTSGAVREHALPAQSQAAPVAVSPDGQWMVVGYGPGALAWVPTTGPADFSVERFEPAFRDDVAGAEVWSLEFSPDGKLVAGGCSDGRVRVWDTMGRGLVSSWEGHASGVTVLRFEPAGMRVFTAGRDSVGLVREVDSGVEVGRVRGLRGGVTDAAWVGTNLVISTGDRGVGLWAVRGERLTSAWTNLPAGTLGAVLTPDGGHFVVAGSFGHQVRRLAGGEVLYQLPPDGEALGSAFVLDRRERELVAGRYWSGGRVGVRALVVEGRTVAFEESGWVPVPRFSGESEIAFDPGGERLAVVDQANGVRVFRRGADALEEVVRVPGFGGRTAAFSSDGSRLVVAGDSRVGLFRAGGGTNALVASWAVPQVQAVAFSESGDRVLVAGVDGVVRILEVSGGEGREPVVLARMSVGLLSVAMSRDGTRVIAGTTDGGVVFWDVGTRRELGVLRVGTGGVYSVRFGDSDELIVAGADGVRVFRVPGGGTERGNGG